MEKIPSVCPYCGCGCGLYLHVENNVLSGVSPSRNHPVNKGSLCVKGWNCFEFVHHPERLKYPLIKRDNIFHKVSWDDALSYIADTLEDIKRRYGPDSIGMLSSAKCTNEENFILMKFARAVIGTNNIDHCTRLCHGTTVTDLASSFGFGAMTNSISEIINAKVLFVIGSNTIKQHPLIGMHMLDAVDRGAVLIVADPRKTQIARLAHIHLRHKSGTDVALLNGIMNIIVNERMVDIPVVKRRTQNFDGFQKIVQKFTPDITEKITGVPASEIRRAARMYASEKRSMLFYATGITQHITGVDNVRSCANLVTLTAHIGLPVTGLNPLRGQNNVQGACDMGVLPDVYTGYQKVTNVQARKKFNSAWNVKLPSKSGMTMTEMFNSARAGKIKAFYIMGENPVLSDPDITRLTEAVERIEFLVVQDIFMSETAQYADVVLPAASFAEKDGTFTSMERRVQKIGKAILPLHGAMADWKIVSEISRRMGYPMEYKAAHEIMEEIALLTPSYGGIFHHRLGDFGLQWPCPDQRHTGTPFLRRRKFVKGLGTFKAIDFVSPAETMDSDFPFILTTGRTSFRYLTGTMCSRTSTLEREEPDCFVEISPADAQRIGVRSNMPVTVVSRRGKIAVNARVSDTVPEGMIFIPFHYRDVAANLITNPAVDPIAKTPEFKVCAVHVVPAYPESEGGRDAESVRIKEQKMPWDLFREPKIKTE
jgi:formate dehydrogenase alpha subunit